MRKTAKKKKPAVSFSPAPEVESVADRLIPLYHLHLLENDVRIEYIFRSESTKTRGREQWGKCRKETSLAAYYCREDDEKPLKPFFAIIISRPVWCRIDEAQQRALVDHELCHAGSRLDGEGNVQLSIIDHDLEEFGAVVERHGLWRRDIKRFAKHMDKAPQTTMDLEE